MATTDITMHLGMVSHLCSLGSDHCQTCYGIDLPWRTSYGTASCRIASFWKTSFGKASILVMSVLIVKIKSLVFLRRLHILEGYVA